MTVDIDRVIQMLASVMIAVPVVTALFIGMRGLGLALRGHRVESAAHHDILIGAAVCSFAVYVMGALGVFHLAAAWVLPGAGLVLAFKIRPDRLPVRPKISLVAAPVVIAFLLSLGAPVTFWDSLAYHLAIPEHLAVTGSLVGDPGYVFGYYPLAMESLYAFVLSLPAGETAAILLNAFFMVLAAHAVVEGLPEKQRRLTCLLLLTTPGIVLLAIIPKNTALLAFAQCVAIRAAWSGRAAFGRDHAASGRDHAASGRSTVLVAGCALGLTAATHYVGLIACVAAAIGLIVRRPPRIAAASLALGLLVAAPSYLRNLFLIGNPFFPFLRKIFGAGTGPAMIEGVYSVGLAGFSEGLARLLGIFTGIEELGVGSTIGPIAAIGIVLGINLLVRAKNHSRNAENIARIDLGITAIGAGLLLGFALLTQSLRFGLGGFFLCAPLAAAGLMRLGRFADVVIGMQSLAAALFLVSGISLPASLLDSLSSDPRYINSVQMNSITDYSVSSLPEGARIATVGVLRPYRWRGRLEYGSEAIQPAMSSALARSKSPAEVRAELRRLGFAYFVVDYSELDRLAAQYGYLRMTDREQEIFRGLIAESKVIKQSGSLVLFEFIETREQTPSGRGLSTGDQGDVRNF